jgi:cellulose synthase/poly-beta-1,6-N-acetylglucosamine synthase-like glycosyltransferase
MSNHPENPPGRFVSAIIPAHNEQEFIAACIASVFKCGHPRGLLEILVVDHSSTDATKALADRAGATVLQLKGGRIGAVRNAGLRAAKGEFIAFVDGDCLVPATWLRSAIHILESDSRIGAVGGPCLSPNTGSWVERSLAPCYVRPGIVKPAKALATSSFIARARLLKEIGQFDESLISGEDDDLSNRIRQRGLALAWASDCHIIHNGYPRTLWEVVRKEIWHGSNHIEVRSGLDLTLALAILFLLTSAGILILLPIFIFRPSITSLSALALNVLLQFAPPLLYAFKQLKQSPRDWPLTLGFLLVGYAYFLGHSLGVLTNIWRRTSSTRKDSR